MSYAIENSYIYEVGNSKQLSTSLTEATLGNYTSNHYYIDNQQGSTAIEALIPPAVSSDIGDTGEIVDVIQMVSAAPFSGQQAIQLTESNGGSVHLTWGFGLGAYLLLLNEIVLIIAGIIELTSHVTFFEQKNPLSFIKKQE